MPHDGQPGCLRVVKLGGAAITRKGELETLDDAALDACVQHIAQVEREGRLGAARAGDDSHAARTVIVHGAGSFGHFQARAAGVAQGWVSAGPGGRQRVVNGLAATRLSVTRLNHEVVSRLVAAGVPSVSMHPFGSWETEDRQRVVRDNADAVLAALRAGLVPVLPGDAVLDSVLGCTILGGDAIVRVLAARLLPESVVFLTNVDGVFDRPPCEAGAVLIPRIDVAPDGTWAAVSACGTTAGLVTSVAEHDVSGGIAEKVSEAAQVAQLGVPVLIAKAGGDAALAALQGLPLRPGGNGGGVEVEPWVGTVATCRQ